MYIATIREQNIKCFTRGPSILVWSCTLLEMCPRNAFLSHCHYQSSSIAWTWRTRLKSNALSYKSRWRIVIGLTTNNLILICYKQLLLENYKSSICEERIWAFSWPQILICSSLSYNSCNSRALTIFFFFIKRVLTNLIQHNKLRYFPCNSYIISLILKISNILVEGYWCMY